MGKNSTRPEGLSGYAPRKAEMASTPSSLRGSPEYGGLAGR